MRLKNVVFTLFDYDPILLDTLYKNEVFVYIICGFENCPKTQRRHIQGYAEFHDPKSLKQLKDIFGKTVHVEPRHGNQRQAIDYCKKGGDFVEIGEPRQTNQGQRNDIKRIVELFEAGHTQYELVTNSDELDLNLNSQTVKLLDKLETFTDRPRDPLNPVEVFWYYGPPGAGKTRAAYEECLSTGQPFYMKTNTTGKWYDGYRGEKIIILDDIRTKYYPFTHLLSILDRYPCRIESKGATRNLTATKIYITCPDHPRKFANKYYSGDDGFDENVKQLMRRITTIKQFD